MFELVQDTSRQLLAAGLTFSYLAGCGALLWQARQRRAAQPKLTAEDSIVIAWASQSGQAQQQAEHLLAAFKQAHLSAQAIALKQLTPEQLQGLSQVIFIVSTYGEGEPPDNAQAFYQQLRRSHLDLSSVNYWLLGLGDSSYQQFCGFAQQLDQQLQRLGAQPQAELHTLDCLHPTDLTRWQSTLNQYFNLEFSQPAPAPSYPLTLINRSCLNPQSSHAGLFHLQFSLPKTAHWQAGDLVKLYPWNDTQHKPREYSLASIQQSGSLDLIVRLAEHHTAQGPEFGLCSGWLCQSLQLGDSIHAELVSNQNFHAPDDSTPLLLIGAGSGLAGLRSHLQQRPVHSRNWLIYGEREPHNDQPLIAELQQWQSSGLLQQLDLTYSRCPKQPHYVQHRLQQQAEQVKHWIAQNGAIYVCGSLKGMGEAVHQTLLEMLGQDAVQQLLAAGRYRRDLY